jgi:hypothetical protein
MFLTTLPPSISRIRIEASRHLHARRLQEKDK